MLRILLAATAVGAVLAFVAVGHTPSGFEGGRAIGGAASIVVAAAILWLAITLPGITVDGFFIGATIVTAAVMSWSHTNQPFYVWTVLAIQAVVLAVRTFPWWRAGLSVVPRMGSAWLGLCLWTLGALSALVMVRVLVAAERIVYLGLAALIVLAVVKATHLRGKDLTIGFVSALLVMLALIVVAGYDNLFTLTHYTPPGPWGARFASRFWGGPELVYHPNLMSYTALAVAMRIAPDARFARWQRIGALAVGLLFLYESNSRTGVLIGLAASGTWAVSVFVTQIWRRRRDQSIVSSAVLRALALAVIPLLLTISVVGVSGGRSFLLQNRYGPASTSSTDPAAVDGDLSAQGGMKGLTSGRTDIWKLIFTQWRSEPLVEKVAGNDDNSRGYILRYGPTVSTKVQPKLTADNAPIGALQRGGVLGVLAFVFGGLLLIYNCWRRRAPLWMWVSLFGCAATIMTEDDTLGGSGSTTWALLLLGEATLFLRGRLANRRSTTPA